MLTPASVVALARAFDLGEVESCDGPVARGQVGEIFRLRTSVGLWAVKRSFAAPDEDETERTTAFAEAARLAGVRTPRACRTRTGRVLLDTADGPLRVHTWVELAGATDSRLDPAAVGRLVARLHQVPDVADGGGGEVHEWYTAPVGAARWAELERRLTAAGAPFAGDLAALRPDLEALEALLTAPRALRTCHRDLFADNIRRGDDGRLWVLDFDNAGPADPVQELAMVLVDIGCGEPARERALVAAYHRAGGPAAVRAPGDFTMVIAALGHINERACTRWLAAAPDDPERNRMAALFAECVERPLTVAAIHATLAALD